MIIRRMFMAVQAAIYWLGMTGCLILVIWVCYLVSNVLLFESLIKIIGFSDAPVEASLQGMIAALRYFALNAFFARLAIVVGVHLILFRRRLAKERSFGFSENEGTARRRSIYALCLGSFMVAAGTLVILYRFLMRDPTLNSGHVVAGRYQEIA